MVNKNCLLPHALTFRCSILVDDLAISEPPLKLLRFCNIFESHIDFASGIAYTVGKAICVLQGTGQLEPGSLQ